MSLKKTHHCWRIDLSKFRGLTDTERSVFLLVLEWFENFRVRCNLEAGADAAEAFWRKEVIPKDRPRDTRQLELWKNAIQWHLNWLDVCAKERADQQSLSVRVSAAVRSAGTRCGLAPRTILCYEKWIARYAQFAGNESKISQLGTANRFLASVLDDDHCAYTTKKQAINALTFFLRHSCGVADPVFDVQLKKAN